MVNSGSKWINRKPKVMSGSSKDPEQPNPESLSVLAVLILSRGWMVAVDATEKRTRRFSTKMMAIRLQDKTSQQQATAPLTTL